MDDGSAHPGGLEQRDRDVRTLLRLVERRTLTADQFHIASAALYGAPERAREVSALLAAAAEGGPSTAALIVALTVPDQYAWTADRVIIWMEDDEARAAVHMREGRSMAVALTKQGVTAERFDEDHEGPVATLRRSFDELLPAPD